MSEMKIRPRKMLTHLSLKEAISYSIFFLLKATSLNLNLSSCTLERRLSSCYIEFMRFLAAIEFSNTLDST